MFSEVSLAHWIMQDGYFNASYKAIVFCTESFTLEECVLLQKVLGESKLILMFVIKIRILIVFAFLRIVCHEFVNLSYLTCIPIISTSLGVRALLKPMSICWNLHNILGTTVTIQ